MSLFKQSILLLFCIISFIYPYAADDLEERASKKPRLEESFNIRWEKVHQIKRGVDLLPKVLEWQSFLNDQEIADVNAALSYCYLKKRNLPKAWYYEFPIILYKLNDQNHLKALKMIKVIHESHQLGDAWYNILKWTHNYDSITYIKSLVNQYNSLYKIPEEDKNISIMKNHIKSAKALKDPNAVVYGAYPPYALLGRSDNRNIPLDRCKLRGKNNEKRISIINENLSKRKSYEFAAIEYPVALMISDKMENQDNLDLISLLDLCNNPEIKHLNIGPLADDNVFLSDRVVEALWNNKSLISLSFISSGNYQSILNILYACSLQKFLQYLEIDFSNTIGEESGYNSSIAKNIRALIANSDVKSLVLKFNIENSSAAYQVVKGVRYLKRRPLENLLLIIRGKEKDNNPLILILTDENIRNFPFNIEYANINVVSSPYSLIYSKSGNWRGFLSKYMDIDNIITKNFGKWVNCLVKMYNKSHPSSPLVTKRNDMEPPILYATSIQKAESIEWLSIYLNDLNNQECSVITMLPIEYSESDTESSDDIYSDSDISISSTSEEEYSEDDYLNHFLTNTN